MVSWLSAGVGRRVLIAGGASLFDEPRGARRWPGGSWRTWWWGSTTICSASRSGTSGSGRRGELMPRLIKDPVDIGAVIAHDLPDLVMNVLLLVGVATILFVLSPGLAALTLLPMPILILFALRYGARVAASFREARARFGSLSAVLQDNLSGVKEIQAFTGEAGRAGAGAGAGRAAHRGAARGDPAARGLGAGHGVHSGGGNRDRGVLRGPGPPCRVGCRSRTWWSSCSTWASFTQPLRLLSRMNEELTGGRHRRRARAGDPGRPARSDRPSAGNRPRPGAGRGDL